MCVTVEPQPCPPTAMIDIVILTQVKCGANTKYSDQVLQVDDSESEVKFEGTVNCLSLQTIQAPARHQIP